jgi:hypothetical protein
VQGKESTFSESKFDRDMRGTGTKDKIEEAMAMAVVALQKCHPGNRRHFDTGVWFPMAH